MMRSKCLWLGLMVWCRYCTVSTAPRPSHFSSILPNVMLWVSHISFICRMAPRILESLLLCEHCSEPSPGIMWHPIPNILRHMAKIHAAVPSSSFSLNDPSLTIQKVLSRRCAIIDCLCAGIMSSSSCISLHLSPVELGVRLCCIIVGFSSLLLLVRIYTVAIFRKKQ